MDTDTTPDNKPSQSSSEVPVDDFDFENSTDITVHMAPALTQLVIRKGGENGTCREHLASCYLHFRTSPRFMEHILSDLASKNILYEDPLTKRIYFTEEYKKELDEAQRKYEHENPFRLFGQTIARNLLS
jgi:hypothetical protein